MTEVVQFLSQTVPFGDGSGFLGLFGQPHVFDGPRHVGSDCLGQAELLRCEAAFRVIRAYRHETDNLALRLQGNKHHDVDIPGMHTLAPEW